MKWNLGWWPMPTAAALVVAAAAFGPWQSGFSVAGLGSKEASSESGSIGSVAQIHSDSEQELEAEGEVLDEVEGDFQSNGFPDPREAQTNEKKAFDTPFGQVVWTDIADKFYTKDRTVWADYKGFQLKLSLNPDLQLAINRELQMQKYITATVVLIEAHTGRIIAMVERRGEHNTPLLRDKSALVSARAPAASLMKIVTATAGIEKGGLDPDDDIHFNGGCGKLRNQNWLRQPNRDRQHLSFARAFGISCNTVFARIALYWTGLATLEKYAEKYYFNKPIPSDLRFETSAAMLPTLEQATALEVGELGAGFGGSKLSPIHSALLSAATANDGVMMAPSLVDAAFDKDGRQVYTAKPREISRVFSKDTAEKMFPLMLATTQSGTSRRYFARKNTRKERFEIGGKTGTLSDAEDRSTLYTWFSGLTALDIPNNVAVSALVASPQNWLVRASSLAQASIAHHLRLQRLEQRLANSKQ